MNPGDFAKYAMILKIAKKQGLQDVGGVESPARFVDLQLPYLERVRSWAYEPTEADVVRSSREAFSAMNPGFDWWDTKPASGEVMDRIQREGLRNISEEVPLLKRLFRRFMQEPGRVM
jgi:hypothetical protein